MLIAQISPAWHGQGNCTCLDQSSFLSVISVSVKRYLYYIYLGCIPAPLDQCVHMGCNSAQQDLVAGGEEGVALRWSMSCTGAYSAFMHFLAYHFP